MRFDNRIHASLEMTNGRPLCPRCRAPLWSVRVQLEDTADDKRMFQCPRCEHSHWSFNQPPSAMLSGIANAHRSPTIMT
jgi:RNase P subunit RPR2